MKNFLKSSKKCMLQFYKTFKSSVLLINKKLLVYQIINSIIDKHNPIILCFFLMINYIFFDFHFFDSYLTHKNCYIYFH